MYGCHRFKKRFFPVAGPATGRRFIKDIEDWVEGFTVEADLREKDLILDLKSYNPLRRQTSAVHCCLGLIPYALGMDLPDEIFEHPIYNAMHNAALDMVTWSNVSFLMRRYLTASLTAHIGRVFV